MQRLSFEAAIPQRIAEAMHIDQADADWVQIAGGGQSLLASSMRRLESLFIPEGSDPSGEKRRVRSARWY